MDPKRFKACLAVLGGLSATTALLCISGEPRATAPFAVAMPEQVLGYRAVSVVFCRNERCARSYTGLPPGSRCAACGGVLDAMAPAERQLLPADTQILRRKYVRPGAAPLLVSVVISSSERRSIHRPQICLVGQGYAIASERTDAVRVPGRAPLRVMLLGLSRRPPGAAGAAPRAETALMAYWFFSVQGQETPYHWQRLLWTARDGVVRNIRPRWAYITIGPDPGNGAAPQVERLEAFIAGLVPRMSGA